MDKDLKEFRAHLIEARQKAYDDFDKTVLALSAGALGVSLTFLKDIIGIQGHSVETLLFIAWLCWGVSVLLVLLSYFTSKQTLNKAIDQIEKGERPHKPGGVFASVTKLLNAFGALLFIIGLFLFIIFVSQNLEVINGKPKQTTNDSNTVTAPDANNPAR